MHLYHPISATPHFADYSGLKLRILLLLILLLIAPFLAGCRRSDPPPEHYVAAASNATGAPLTLSSTDLKDEKFPRAFTCDGDDKSPTLTWSAPPSGTKSLVLTVTDPDAPGGIFTHWILYNLPATSSLPAGFPKQDQLADGTRQGRNDFSKPGYGGPCGPHGSTHRYFFDLFALDTNMDVPASATRVQLEDAMNTHVLARGKLMARYSR